MSVFFVHDINRRMVTPLDRKYYVRQIPETTETEEITPIVPDRINLDAQQHKRRNALETYRDTTSRNDDEKPAASQSGLTYGPLGTVRQIMSKQILSASPEHTIEQAWDLMSRHSIHHLAIIDDKGFLCGFVSESDLLEQLVQDEQQRASQTLMEVFCENDVISTGIDTEVRTLGDYMLKADIDGLPVTDNGRLCGVVTATDILKRLLDTSGVDRTV